MAHLFLKRMLADCSVICVSWIPIMDKSLLKRLSITASNLETLLAKPLTFREAIEMVCDVSFNEGDDIALAYLFDVLFCKLSSDVEGRMPGGEFEFLEPLM